MKQKNALAYLRQLCCSGLGKEIVIPEFLRAVQVVLPSGSNVFTGADEQLNPTYHLLEFVIDDINELIPIIIANYLTPERRRRSAAWINRYPAMTDWRFLDESFYKSDLYNLVYRRYDQHHCLHAPVKQSGKPVGMLTLHRPRQQKPFNKREQALCLELLPYLALALHEPNGYDNVYSESRSSSMLIMDAQGAILYLSQAAANLLALASQPLLTAEARINKAELLEKLAQLCRNLDTVFRGQAAATPSWSFTGPRGRFMFRAYWLNKYNKEPGGLIGMTVEHQEPMVLTLFRAMRNLPLSPTQKEVSTLMAQGYSNEKIGERLHIKLTTVKDHIGKIFIKLDIQRREELLPMLLTLDVASDPLSERITESFA